MRATAAFEANLLACIDGWRDFSQGELEDDGNVTRFASGTALPFMNIAMARAPLDNPMTQIAETARFFASRNLPFLWWDLPSSRSAMLTASLLEQGFILVQTTPGMAADLTVVPPLPELPELTISRVSDETAMRRWAEVAFLGNEIAAEAHGELVAFIMQYYRCPAMRLYLAHHDGTPVAGGMLVEDGGVAGIYWVATIPEARRRGFGAALTHYLMCEGHAHGCDIAVLAASAMGKPVYARLGFAECCAVDMYLKVQR